MKGVNRLALGIITVTVVLMAIDAPDFDGDGKISPWEKLCFWIIAGFISIYFGKELM